MKNKSLLLMLELVLMTLVLAVCCALCLRLFAWAQVTAADSADRDRAFICAQNTAQYLKGSPHLHNTAHTVDYDAEWTPSDIDAAYRLTSTPRPGERPLLGGARIQVLRLSDGQLLAALDVTWQEVNGLG